MTSASVECRNCHKLLPADTGFCDYCGNPARGRTHHAAPTGQNAGARRRESLRQKGARSALVLSVAAVAVTGVYLCALALATLNQENRLAGSGAAAPAGPASAARAEPAADLNLQVQRQLHRILPQNPSSKEGAAAVRTLPDGLLLTTSPDLARTPAGVKTRARIGADSLVHDKLGGDDATGASWLSSPDPWDSTGMRVAPPQSLTAGDTVFNISLTPGNAVTTTAGTVIEAEGRIISVRLDNHKRDEHGILVTVSGCLAGVNLPAAQDRGGVYPNVTRAVNAARLPPLEGKTDPTCIAPPAPAAEEPAQ